MKRALITGVSGQDGSYLAEYLLELGYEVFGLIRREPGSLRWLQPIQDRIELLYGDMRDAASLGVAFHKAWPDEVYNLAGQVFVPTSWEIPEETFDINVGGLTRLLRIVESERKTLQDNSLGAPRRDAAFHGTGVAARAAQVGSPRRAEGRPHAN